MSEQIITTKSDLAKALTMIAASTIAKFSVIPVGKEDLKTMYEVWIAEQEDKDVIAVLVEEYDKIIKYKTMSDKEIITGLSQTIESQKQTFDALVKKYDRLDKTFEELLVEQFVLSELRDFWRLRARTKK